MISIQFIVDYRLARCTPVRTPQPATSSPIQDHSQSWFLRLAWSTLFSQLGSNCHLQLEILNFIWTETAKYLLDLIGRFICLLNTNLVILKNCNRSFKMHCHSYFNKCFSWGGEDWLRAKYSWRTLLCLAESKSRCCDESLRMIHE